MDEHGKTQKVNVQVIKITYQVHELKKYLPDEKACGHVTKCHAHPKLIEDLHGH